MSNQDGTALGPLTTTWTMPDSCTVNMLNCATCEVAYQGQECFSDDDEDDPGALRDNYKCWPPIKAGLTPHEAPLAGWGFYSPGIACPSGYTSACTAVYGENSDWPVKFQLTAHETAVGCCPSGYKCADSDKNTCTAVATTSTEVPTARCSSGRMINWATATLPEAVTNYVTESNTISTELVTLPTTLYAPMFQLNFQSSDVKSEPKDDSTDTDSRTTTGSHGSDHTEEASNKGSNGMSSGTIAGVTVGSVLGLLGLVALAACVIWQRRKKRKLSNESGQADMDMNQVFSYSFGRQSQQQQSTFSHSHTGNTHANDFIRSTDSVSVQPNAITSENASRHYELSASPVPIEKPIDRYS